MSAPTVGRRWREGHLVTVALLCTRGTPVLHSSSLSGPWQSANTSSTWTASRARSDESYRHSSVNAANRMLQLNCLMMSTDKSTLSIFHQSKIHAARSLSEIAIDLTETGTLKTSKLANMGSKGKIISGSSGSLLSSGQYTVSACLWENKTLRTWEFAEISAIDHSQPYMYSTKHNL